MTITLTIDNAAEAQRVLDGLCTASDYDPGSGLTKGQWVTQQLIKFLKLYAKRGENKTSAINTSAAIDAIVIY